MVARVEGSVKCMDGECPSGQTLSTVLGRFGGPEPKLST